MNNRVGMQGSDFPKKNNNSEYWNPNKYYCQYCKGNLKTYQDYADHRCKEMGLGSMAEVIVE